MPTWVGTKENIVCSANARTGRRWRRSQIGREKVVPAQQTIIVERTAAQNGKNSRNTHKEEGSTAQNACWRLRTLNVLPPPAPPLPSSSVSEPAAASAAASARCLNFGFFIIAVRDGLYYEIDCEESSVWCSESCLVLGIVFGVGNRIWGAEDASGQRQQRVVNKLKSMVVSLI